jgi:hypothetical protein
MESGKEGVQLHDGDSRGGLVTHLVEETLSEVPSVQFPGHYRSVHHLAGGCPLLCYFFVRWCHQHVVPLDPPIRPGFYCCQPDRNVGGLHYCIGCLLHDIVNHLIFCVVLLIMIVVIVIYITFVMSGQHIMDCIDTICMHYYHVLLGLLHQTMHFYSLSVKFLNQ